MHVQYAYVLNYSAVGTVRCLTSVYNTISYQQSHTHTHTHTDRQTDTNRQTQTHTDTDTHTHRHTQTDTHNSICNSFIN